MTSPTRTLVASCLTRHDVFRRHLNPTSGPPCPDKINQMVFIGDLQERSVRSNMICIAFHASFIKHLLAPENVVVVLREPMRLVANGLTQFQAEILAPQLDGGFALLHEDQLFLLGE
jgi:hypothetical protein